MINPQMIMQIKNFMSNPQQALRGMGVPQQYMNNPQGLIQHMMDTGKLSQAQYMQLKQQAMEIQSMLK